MAASGLGKCDLMWCEHDEHHRCSQSHLSQVHFDYDFVVWVMTIQRWLTVIAFKTLSAKVINCIWFGQRISMALAGLSRYITLVTPTWKFFSHASSADRSHSWRSCRSFHISRKSIPCRCCRFLRFQHKYFRHISTILLPENWAHNLVRCLIIDP